MLKTLVGLPKRLLKSVGQIKLKGLSKNPSFYFGFAAIVLMGSVYFGCNSYSNFAHFQGGGLTMNSTFFNTADAKTSDNLFFDGSDKIALETPDLKTIEDNTISGISVPSAVSVKVLGDVFGATTSSDKKEITNYTVQSGDTFQSIAAANNIALNTLLWANDLTSSSKITVGQNLTILPVDGVLHAVKSGDTMGAIAQAYKANADTIIAFNNLANQDDMYVGDILVVPGGVMPKKSIPVVNNTIPLADNYFIFPVQGRITQGLHYYNAIDIANACGTPVYAAAAGVVQRAVNNGGWNNGMGNYVTILHGNGTVTYYGHFSAVLVKAGDKVDVGQNIGLTGRTGDATGCHLHFEVIGAKNPLAKYPVGTMISYKQSN